MTRQLPPLLENYRLQDFLQIVTAGVCLIDADKKIVYWNKEAQRITGYGADEVLGQPCTLLHRKDEIDTCDLFLDAKKASPQQHSCLFVHKDGRALPLTKNVDLLRNGRGQVLGVIEVFIDGVGHREVELERNALRSILNGMRDPVYICDRNRRLLFVNQALKNLRDISNDQPCYQALYGRKEICPDCPMDKVMGGAVISQETRFAGINRTFEVVHSACHFGDVADSKLGVCRDITDRLAIRHRLQQVNRELDAFVSMVSHDLRSPLTPLIGFAELLKERYSHAMDETGRESISEICFISEKMRDLLEDLLCLARVGQAATPCIPVAVEPVVRDVLRELDNLTQNNRVQIEIRDLPAVLIPESLLADLYRNLLSNALKYANARSLKIVICAETSAGKTRLMVRDNGPGVAVAERQQIFDPFVRGDAAKNHAGTGIGLATVAKIAQVYGGRAWVEETPGGGATFIVELPATQTP